MGSAATRAGGGFSSRVRDAYAKEHAKTPDFKHQGANGKGIKSVLASQASLKRYKRECVQLDSMVFRTNDGSSKHQLQQRGGWVRASRGLQIAAGPWCGACMGRWWSSLVPIPTGNVEGGPGIEQRHDTRRVEGDACGLGHTTHAVGGRSKLEVPESNPCGRGGNKR
eukprot:1151187-Pelagomonas_calceolata.AAC.5